MYSTLDSGEPAGPSGLKRLAARDLRIRPQLDAAAKENAATTAVAAPAWPVLTLGNGLAWLMRGMLWIVVLAVLGAIGGIGYGMLVPARFTATTDLVIDPGNLQVMSNDLYAAAVDQNAQLLDVESKLRVLTSGNVLRRVVEELKLTDDPEFAGEDAAIGGLGGGEARDPIVGAVDALAKKVGAWREERSFVVTLSVSTQSADKSVKIADAIVAAFQAELAKSEADGAARAADSLMARLSELRAGVTAAEDAVETFRKANGLEASGSGELINTQSMTLLNSRAVDAQQAVIAAQARYDELTDPVTGKANAAAVQTATMVALRTQFGTLQQQGDSYAALYGPLHPNRTSIERQLKGLEQQIAAETARAVQAARLELEQAKRTIADLDQQTNSARDTVATDSQAQVELRDLERDAKAKSDVYEAFLSRAREMTERQQLDTTNIRVISPATPPSARSWPPRTIVLAGLGVVGGLALGVALALGLGFIGETRRLRSA